MNYRGKLDTYGVSKERPKTIDIFPWRPYNKNTNTVYMTGQREVPRAWCNIIKSMKTG